MYTEDVLNNLHRIVEAFLAIGTGVRVYLLRLFREAAACSSL